MVTVGDRVAFKMRGRVLGFDPDCKELCEIEVICEAFPNEVSWRVWRETKSVEVIKRFKPPPFEPKEPLDKPPRIKANDWVIKDGWTKPMQVMERRSDTTLTMWHCGHIVRDEDVRVYRRSDAPLQKGDQGLLGNVECWITQGEKHSIMEPGFIMVVFSREQISKGDQAEEGAWINRSRFTLVEPVYPDGEKLSGKESKED